MALATAAGPTDVPLIEQTIGENLEATKPVGSFKEHNPTGFKNSGAFTNKQIGMFYMLGYHSMKHNIKEIVIKG